MLWYAGSTKQLKSLVKYRKINSLKKLKKAGFSKKPRTSIYFQHYPLHVPKNWNLIIIQKGTDKNFVNSSVYLYSKLYYFWFNIDHSHSQIIYDYSTQTIATRTMYSNIYSKVFWRALVDLFTTIHKPFFLKLKFKGKGYYLYKNKRGTVTPQFGYSHRLYMYSYFVRIKFLSKTSVILFGFIKNDLLTVGMNLKKMRPINIFTGRGVRFNKQTIYKKVGKVSSYR